MNSEPFRPPQIEQIVTMLRLSLYNHALPCGPQAIRNRFIQLDIRPIPSITTIQRILTRHSLTHRRTGHYP